MTARRCSTFWSPFRAMSCSRRACPTSIRIVTGIFGLQERPRVRLLLRRDPFRRFYSCLVFVPREKYNTQVRQRIERVIGEAFAAFGMESQVQIAESNLARIHIVARTLPTEAARIDAAAHRAARRGRRALLGRFIQDRAAGALRRGVCAEAVRDLCAGFPAAYTEDFQGDAAALDVTFLEAADKEPQRLHLDIYRPEPRPQGQVFPEDLPRPGCDSDFGSAADAREHGAEGDRRTAVRARVPGRTAAPGFRTSSSSSRARRWTNSKSLEREIKSAFTAVWTGRMDNDSFNRLTLRGRRAVAHRDRAARLLPLSAANGSALQPGVHRAGAGEQCRTSRAASPSCSRRASTPTSPTAARRGALARLDQQHPRGARGGHGLRRGPHPARVVECAVGDRAHQRLPDRRTAGSSRTICPSRSKARSCASCRCRSRCSRYSCSRRAWRACICAWDTSRAAASAGRTGARTSAPRCSG